MNMTENKWQHFVPQFYFRYFSNDSETILGYNLKGKNHYKSPIVSQAAKNYFYTPNTEIEKSFSPIESKFNVVLKKIIDCDNFRLLTGEEYMEMLRFISFQGSRTEKAKLLADDFVDKMVDKVMKPFMKSNKELMSKVTEKDIDKIKITYPAAFFYRVIYSLESNILLTDLVPALIVNKTEQDFIFSDNPVVYYNLIYRDPRHAFEGNTHPGLIILCPISSKKCLFLFDPIYYGVKLDNKNTLELSNLNDVKAINKLQFHNSLKNIYYRADKQKESIDNLSKEYFSEYSKDKDLSQIKEIPNWNGKNSLLVTSKKGIPEKVNLSFIECAKPFREVCVVRNPELTNLFDEKMKLYGFKRGE